MAQVPSNLIPLRVTQLPTAPVASEDSLMMIVYQGNNYQIRVGDLLSVAGVPTSRQVIAGTGMSGGGQLSSNVTLSVASKGINGPLLADTGVTAGVYGNATTVPVLTVDSTGRVTAASSVPVTVSGYVPESREIIAGAGLTGGGTLNANVTLAADLADTTPEAGFQSGSAGTSEAVSRADHKHPAVDLSSDDEVDNLLGLSNGGTAKSLVPDAGAIIWCGADGLYVGPVGDAGQVLISNGTGEYTWGSALVVTPQAANTFFSGPASGGNADPLFRAMVNADLPNSGATPGSYGSLTAIPIITVNGKGIVTSITSTSFTGGLEYKGNWNAQTNTPTLTSSVGTNGNYYTVSVAGTTNLNGITDWQVGDWAIFNGSEWQKIDQSNTVTSVNGEVGAVVLDYTDVGAPSATGTGASGTWAIDISGNAATVTNGVYTTGSYADPTWLTSLATSKLSGTVSNAQLANSAITINGSAISLGGAVSVGTVTSVAATAGTGISVTGSPVTSSGTLAITNTAPDQTVVLNNGTGISVTGTYPNFTVTNTAPSSGGTVTSVAALTLGTSGTDLSSSVANGTTTPVITLNVPTASATNRGALSAADWSTFNGKQPAGIYVNSVSGTSGRVTSTGGVTPVIDLASGVVTAGTTGSATLIPVITVDTYGRVTSITTASNPQGTVTSVSGTGTVNGLTLTGTVTSSGNLTLGGALNLSSPPVIGNTVPAAITGTTITATTYVGVSGGTF